jgi:aryl-alcohol dehydrogenase-like predicted oxidoreductase
MARLGRRESVHLLEVAHASGITHFDTARAYGYGEAESALGEFLSRRRDNVTVTTKLGIVPPRRSRALQAAKVAGRTAARRLPAARALLRGRAQAMVQTGRFDPADARASLETSLRELAVETVDILLLHECRPEDLRTEGLLDFLERSVREGKARYFGVATDVESTRAILSAHGPFARVVQLAHNPLEPALESLPALAGRAVITHSAMRTALGPLRELMRDPRRCGEWSHRLDVNCGRPGVLARLLLAYALESNRGGVVLFASTHEQTIRSNADLAEGTAFSAAQIAEFVRLTRGALAVPGTAALAAP